MDVGPDAMSVVISSEPCDERSFFPGERISPKGRNDRQRGRNDMVIERKYYVYILTNWNNRVLYIGVTSDLTRRLNDHKNKVVNGFTEKYYVNKLVYFQETNDVLAAITREKEIKKWRRQKKDYLVSSMNPDWKDLSDSW